jgi:hypothetical protein
LQTYRQIERQAYRDTYIHTYMYTYVQTDRHTYIHMRSSRLFNVVAFRTGFSHAASHFTLPRRGAP